MNTKKQHILVIEDEEDVTQFLQMALEDAGYDVTVAMSAETAMQSLETGKPDLITLDLIMPNRTGISLYGELRKSSSYQAIPIVVITGIDQTTKGMISYKEFFKDKKSVREPEAYLVKPVTAKNLIDTVQQVLAP